MKVHYIFFFFIKFTVVSIAHSKEVEKYHEKVLALKSGGGWEHGDSKE